MPVVTDANGTREVSNRELEEMNVEADERWVAFFSSREWRPIAEYERGTGEVKLLRAGVHWAAGYWGAGVPEIREEGDDVPDLSPMWRHAQDSVEGLPLAFEPTEFAAIDDDWRVDLVAD